MEKLKPCQEYRDGEPCEHKGCLHHNTHPCEGCGRIAGHNKQEAWNRREGE